MGTILDQVEGSSHKEPVHGERCPVCGRENARQNHCRHVRWTLEQGDPLDFAKYALQSSPYVRGRGHAPSDIPQAWWLAHGDWIIEQIDFRLHIGESYVFGEISDLDLLARDIWKSFQPDRDRAGIQRMD